LTLGGILAFQNTTVGYRDNRYGNVFLFYASALFTVLGLCFISILMARVNLGFVQKALTYAGQKTLPILLMHKFPILFFQVLFPWTRQPLKNNDPVVGFLTAVVSIAACLAVDKLLEIILAFCFKKKGKAGTP
jgi:fucose 4-O-acetylase-like acetyltransferase